MRDARWAAGGGRQLSIYYTIRTYVQEHTLAKRRSRSTGKAAKVSEAKVAMSYRLSPAKIARAQDILGTSTATATIEEALDLVIFRRELTEGLERVRGIEIADAFPDPPPKRGV